LAITLGSVGSPGSFSGGAVSGKNVADIGKDALFLVKRHDKSGRTHSPESAEYFDVSKNTHITVGNNTMPIRALWKIYGDNLCPAPLMSLQKGNARFYCCDQAHDPDHCSLFSPAHQLPPFSGPSHPISWDKCRRHAGQPHKRNNDPEVEEGEDARAVIQRAADNKKKKKKTSKKRK
jgi:hypothetical protein